MFTQEEWDDAPAHDNIGLFIHFEQLARAKVEALSDSAANQDIMERSSAEDRIRRQYVITVFALAKKLGIRLNRSYKLEIIQKTPMDAIYNEVCIRADAIALIYDINNHLNDYKYHINIMPTYKEKILKLIFRLKEIYMKV